MFDVVTLHNTTLPLISRRAVSRSWLVSILFRSVFSIHPFFHARRFELKDYSPVAVNNGLNEVFTVEIHFRQGGNVVIPSRRLFFFSENAPGYNRRMI